MLIRGPRESIRAVLSGAASPAPTFVAMIHEAHLSGREYESVQKTDADGATQVKIVDEPGDDAVRKVIELICHNADDAAITVTISWVKVDAAGETESEAALMSLTLAAGEQLTWGAGSGWRVITTSGATKTVGSTTVDGSALGVGELWVGDSNGAAQAVAMGGDATINEAGNVSIADQKISGVHASNSVAGAAVAAVPCVFQFLIPSGADANTDIIMPYKCRVIDAWAIPSSLGSDASVQVINSGNAVTDSINVITANEIHRFTQIDDAYWDVSATAALRVASSSGAANFPGATVYVMCVRAA